jgi:hypothetical protein
MVGIFPNGDGVDRLIPAILLERAWRWLHSAIWLVFCPFSQSLKEFKYRKDLRFLATGMVQACPTQQWLQSRAIGRLFANGVGLLSLWLIDFGVDQRLLRPSGHGLLT